MVASSGLLGWRYKVRDLTWRAKPRARRNKSEWVNQTNEMIVEPSGMEWAAGG